ncbi:hypothetical protein BM221_009331 [Beauveria bassiana]|uniref:Uncharacterized protein n=1 Tax=Beauveria bassiana TaxID=176275 RepID=A0A2N6NB35_BEABA|nr:hypothetical protein BM221_009331 [Beauveria bassiana]
MKPAAVAGALSFALAAKTNCGLENVQIKCAQLSVTIIPGIEAPGHCLRIVQWRPQIWLPVKPQSTQHLASR